jgi:hypothetical protein
MLALDGKVKLFGKGIYNRMNSKSTDSKALSYQPGEITVVHPSSMSPQA